MNNIVLIESPYRNGDRNRNLRYLAWCEFHSASLGENPIASHGNCTAYWPEDEEHRAKGFAWRDAVRDACDAVIFYTDLGMSEGQQLAELRDSAVGMKCVRRKLPDDLKVKFDSGEYPPGSMRRVIPEPPSAGDEWVDYVVSNAEGGYVGRLVLLSGWTSGGILMELEARHYLKSSPSGCSLFRDGEQLRVEGQNEKLFLSPTGVRVSAR